MGTKQAFREGQNFLTIDPFECIDCDACVSECPVEAIYPDDEVPEKWEYYIELNEQLAEEWYEHIINETKDPLPDTDAKTLVYTFYDKMQRDERLGYI